MSKLEFPILPEKFHVNIDTVKFSVNDINILFDDVTKVLVTTAAGEPLLMKTNRKPFVGAFKRHNLQMRYAVRENHVLGELSVEGSLYGNRYGQNVHTSSNLKNACLSALKRIGEAHALSDFEGWSAEQIQLHRVDLAVNFKLESEHQVNRALAQLRLLLAAQPIECHLYKTYVSLAPRGGKNYLLSAYAKGAQMRKLLSRNSHDENFAKLAKECEPILRVELHLMGSELKRLKLDNLSGWSGSTARNVFRKYFARLPLGGMTFGPLRPDDFEGIDMRMRPAFAHHKLGTDMTLIYCERTRQRHRASWKKLAIDLNVPNQPMQPIPLSEIMSKRGAIVKAPDWLTDAGMAPRTKKRLQSSRY